MRVAIVGGKLQGVEVAYLARKAGWETVLIDKIVDTPATGLCDHSIVCDVTTQALAAPLFNNIDLIIPALENANAPTALGRTAASEEVPLAFDAAAYRVTASKIRSNQLFKRLNLPVPAIWPMCDFPMIVKPDYASGSKGIRLLINPVQLNDYLRRKGSGDRVIQEFISGPTFSIEIIGMPGAYHTPQVTDLFMDCDYDCKAVCVPTSLKANDADLLKQMARTIAAGIGLYGIMDLEVVLGTRGLKILEIDARFPSQTPTVVYWSTGINMVEMMGALFLGKNPVPTSFPKKAKYVLYEHIRLDPGGLEVSGEKMIGRAGSLHLETDFFGATEALTDYRPGSRRWVATMIYCANDRQALKDNRTETVNAILKQFKCDRFIDSVSPTQAVKS